MGPSSHRPREACSSPPSGAARLGDSRPKLGLSAPLPLAEDILRGVVADDIPSIPDIRDWLDAGTDLEAKSFGHPSVKLRFFRGKR